MGKRGEAFGRWYYAQSKGRQFGLCLVPLVVMVFGFRVLLPMPESVPDGPEGTVRILCEEGTSHIFVRVDDPRLDPDSISNAGLDRICEQEL